MNIILFENAEAARFIPGDDPRAGHIREVLRTGLGGRLYVGVVNGPRALAEVIADGPEGLRLACAWEPDPATPVPVALLAGLPRPQTARRLLFDGACHGLRELGFFGAERGEASYAASSLWEGEWRRQLVRGAEQGFACAIPEVAHHRSLEEALGAGARLEGAVRCVALDVYEGAGPLPAVLREGAGAGAVRLALGPERGWSPAERELLRGQGWELAHLGGRVLRTETAANVAIGLVKAHLGLF